jgi:hypothetical protein
MSVDGAARPTAGEPAARAFDTPSAAGTDRGAGTVTPVSRALVVLVIAVLAVATTVGVGGCGDDSSPTACADIYAKGKVVTAQQVHDGCTLKNGSTLTDNVCERVDGALLVTFKGSHPPLWGFAGKPLRAASGGDLAHDPRYKKAVALC